MSAKIQTPLPFLCMGMPLVVITSGVVYFRMCFPAGGVLCVACHPFDASFAHAAMVEDTLTCFHDVYHATLKDKASATHCYEVYARGYSD